MLSKSMEMCKFTIESIYRHNAELVTVKVTMDAKTWAHCKASGLLGCLYGIDISNEVYRTSGVNALHPIVCDTLRAKGGIKLIELSYADTKWVEVDNVIRVDFKTRRRVAA
jgi:hypothetical protein